MYPITGAENMNTAFKIIMAAILFLAVLYHFWRHRRTWVRGMHERRSERARHDF